MAVWRIFPRPEEYSMPNSKQATTVGALYMFSVPRGYSDGFTQWCKQIVGLCLTAFLQSTILVAGLMVFSIPSAIFSFPPL